MAKACSINFIARSILLHPNHVCSAAGAFFGSIAPRLQVRFYSISSGPGLHPKAVHITCAYIREATPTGRLHEGVCSQQFSRLQPGDTVSAYIRRSPLHLPQNVSDPIVMVGPGTGLAPFRGFLQQRAHMLAQGKDTTSV